MHLGMFLFQLLKQLQGAPDLIGFRKNRLQADSCQPVLPEGIQCFINIVTDESGKNHQFLLQLRAFINISQRKTSRKPGKIAQRISVFFLFYLTNPKRQLLQGFMRLRQPDSFKVIQQNHFLHIRSHLRAGHALPWLRLELRRFVPSQLPHCQLILKISASAFPLFSYKAYSG